MDKFIVHIPTSKKKRSLDKIQESKSNNRIVNVKSHKQMFLDLGQVILHSTIYVHLYTIYSSMLVLFDLII